MGLRAGCDEAQKADDEMLTPPTGRAASDRRWRIQAAMAAGRR
jgi:hypothetical protein